MLLIETLDHLDLLMAGQLDNCQPVGYTIFGEPLYDVIDKQPTEGVGSLREACSLQSVAYLLGTDRKGYRSFGKGAPLRTEGYPYREINTILLTLLRTILREGEVYLHSISLNAKRTPRFSQSKKICSSASAYTHRPYRETYFLVLDLIQNFRHSFFRSIWGMVTRFGAGLTLQCSNHILGEEPLWVQCVYETPLKE